MNLRKNTAFNISSSCCELNCQKKSINIDTFSHPLRYYPDKENTSNLRVLNLSLDTRNDNIQKIDTMNP